MSYTTTTGGFPGGFPGGFAGTIPSRTEAVLAAIKRAILAGEVKPGQSLVEADLARWLGVSKTPVREALKTLAGTGLVTMSPYRGAAVRSIGPLAAAALYDLRLLLEPEAVRRAAHGAAIGEAASEALARADAAVDDAQRSLANRDFHRALYAGCGNPLLVQALDGLRDQTALVSAAAWRQDAGHAPGQSRVVSWQREAAQHRAILAAGRAGDADGAARLLRDHIGDFAARNFAPGKATTGEPAAGATGEENS